MFLAKHTHKKSFLNRLLERIHLLNILNTWQTSSFLLEEYPALTYQILNRLQNLLERSQEKNKEYDAAEKNCPQSKCTGSWRIELLWGSISLFMSLRSRVCRMWESIQRELKTKKTFSDSYWREALSVHFWRVRKTLFPGLQLAYTCTHLTGEKRFVFFWRLSQEVCSIK